MDVHPVLAVGEVVEGLGDLGVVDEIEVLEGILEDIPVHFVGQKVQQVLLVKLALQVEEHRLMGYAGGFRVHRIVSSTKQRYEFLVDYPSISTV